MGRCKAGLSPQLGGRPWLLTRDACVSKPGCGSALLATCVHLISPHPVPLLPHPAGTEPRCFSRQRARYWRRSSSVQVGTVSAACACPPHVQRWCGGGTGRPGPKHTPAPAAAAPTCSCARPARHHHPAGRAAAVPHRKSCSRAEPPAVAPLDGAQVRGATRQEGAAAVDQRDCCTPKGAGPSLALGAGTAVHDCRPRCPITPTGAA